MPIVLARCPTCKLAELPNSDRLQQVGRRVNLQQRQVEAAVMADHQRWKSNSFLKFDLDLLRAFDDVIVCKNVSIVVDHEAGAESFARDHFGEKAASLRVRCHSHNRRGDTPVQINQAPFSNVQPLLVNVQGRRGQRGRRLWCGKGAGRGLDGSGG